MNTLPTRLRRIVSILWDDMHVVSFVLAVSILQGLVFAAYHQVTGNLPTTHSLSFFWLYEIPLPFGVSRVWDIFTIPLLTLLAYGFIYDLDQKYGDLECSFLYVIFILTWVITLACGIAYLPIAFVASIAILCAFVLGIMVSIFTTQS